MAIAVQSMGALVGADTGLMSLSWSSGSLQMYDQYWYDYATLYRTQPNVRTCVDFLARNIAQLGLHVFRRVNETDRQRLRDHPLARLIAQPNPYTTRYRLIEALMGDLGVWFNAYWLKVRGGGGQLALLRIPPALVSVAGGLVPTAYEINLGSKTLKLAPDEIVHFRGFNAESSVLGLSPLETLRRVLAEEAASADYREHFWQNSARMNGIIMRPKDAGQWSLAARERFKREFEALYSGGENSGRTAILEEGMTWKETTFNAQESEYLAGRKLTREECARAYHIPLPMVGILDHATFSNIREQHKNLYQDALGPWLTMIEEEIELQLLREMEDSDGVYCEFNIQEKLAGSFEEQVASLQSAVGVPWMTVNEARARMNLPSQKDGDGLATPLNMLPAGAVSALPEDDDESADDDEEPADDESVNTRALSAGERKADGEIDPSQPELRRRHEEKWRQTLARTFSRQRDAVLGKFPKGLAPDGQKAEIADIWDSLRWDTELREDILRLNILTAGTWARYVTEQLDVELDEGLMRAWLEENARIAAEEINAYTRDQLAGALMEEEPRSVAKRIFDIAVDVRAIQIATTAVTRAIGFGSTEGARQGGLKTKTWIVNSKTPRPSHAALNGVTVRIGENFPGVNMRWPGDPAGGAAEVANCSCSVRFGR